MRTKLTITGLLLSLLAATGVSSQASDEATAPKTSQESAAVGDLLVAPTRFVFEGNQRSAEVTLVNIGENVATYRISFINLAMSETGEVREVESEEAEMPASPLIRFSPRQVKLEPQVAQTVRMQIRKPANLELGEYRSHMLFRAIPPANLSTEPTEADKTGLHVRLIPVYGVSIPVIVRHETEPSTANIESLALDPGRTESQPFDVVCTLGRQGLESVYGDLRVIQIVSGREHVIGALGGIAVYTPLYRRVVRIPVTPLPETSISEGTVIVRYQTVDPDARILAEAQLNLAEGS